jgi:hypothetical protein
MIVSITGLIGSGKDTIADYLISSLGFKQISFGFALKDTMAAMFQWDREMLEGKTPEARKQRDVVDEWWSEKLGIPNFTPRYALTRVGTEVLRHKFNDNIWVYNVQKALMKLSDSDNIVISDTRFMPELYMLEELNALTLQVTRGPLPAWYQSALNHNKLSTNWEKALYKFYLKHSKSPNFVNQDVHLSERDWIGYKFNHTLFNDGTIDDLKKNVDMFILPKLVR